MADIDLGEYTRNGEGSPRLRAHLAVPAGEGPWPGVVITHEAWGVDEQMRAHADRLARLGYLTVVPDLYSEGGMARCVVRVLLAMRSGRGRAIADIAAAKRWLLDRDDCTGRVGVVGFCMGGGFALATVADFDASAVNYGFIPRNLEGALDRACPVVGSFGARDGGLRGAAGELRAALDAAGVANDVKEYPEAGHSFLNEAPNGPKALRPVFRAMHTGPHPESAADAWERIDAFLTEHLALPADS
ncbi:dienelactone hydrolase family protein [Nocardiopsis changdeensis]|uniref:Dienelactone hydrolase family protein n=1 Tax=Nocardiopsis changdeensis TaxID=2831969 RepID=A0ABX8BNM8_9ACTN|nr:MULTISPECIES: dienelactone hydrolase family protein [Nocardiopsis]QUX22348.1 dienelactone hydrolase family protein [Nocardiopsis changdeensis]QYX38289.1 dienelactone hydrolase family protein [Nocardiopsis sp. MT53]